MSDQDLSKKIEDYAKLAQENPNVDVNLLMMSALKQEAAGKSSNKSYKWPYTIALGLPPLGLGYAAKYYFFSDDENDKQAAKICVFLTIASVLVLYFSSKLIFSSAGVTPTQIEQIKPSDVYQLTQ